MRKRAERSPRSVRLLQVPLLGAAAAALLLVVTGCVTPDAPAGMAQTTGDSSRVVERSRPQAPEWTRLAAGRVHETETAYQYVELRTRLRDLPLGLKQTQLGALEASRGALVAVVHDRLEGDRGSLSSYGTQQLDRVVADVVTDVHGRYAKVSDIYFEKLESEDDAALREYFNAFVLISLPRASMGDLLDGVGRRLVGSGDPSLKRLGDALRMESRSLIPAQVKSDDLSH